MCRYANRISRLTVNQFLRGWGFKSLSAHWGNTSRTGSHRGHGLASVAAHRMKSADPASIGTVPSRSWKHRHEITGCLNRHRATWPSVDAPWLLGQTSNRPRIGQVAKGMEGPSAPRTAGMWGTARTQGSVAQRQSTRLLTGGSWCRNPPGLPAPNFGAASGASLPRQV